MSILVVDKNLHDLMRSANRHFILQRGCVVWNGRSVELDADHEVRQKHLGF